MPVSSSITPQKILIACWLFAFYSLFVNHTLLTKEEEVSNENRIQLFLPPSNNISKKGIPQTSSSSSSSLQQIDERQTILISLTNEKCQDVIYWSTNSKIFDHCWLSSSSGSSNRTRNENTALVISDTTTNSSSSISNGGWHRAQELSQKYKHFKHLYKRHPPIHKRLSIDELQHLSPEYTHAELLLKNTYNKYHNVILQPMTSRENLLEFTFRNEHLCHDFVQFNTTILISDRQAFSKTLLSEVESLMKLLSHEPWMVDNFVVYLDSRGRLYHSDLDRHDDKKSKSKIVYWQHQYELIQNTLEYIANHYELPEAILKCICRRPTLTQDGNSNESVPPPFQWNMLNPSKPAKCGFEKCFFRDKSNPQYGYAVSMDSVRTKVAWDMSQILTNQYHAYHVYLGPPQSIPVNELVLQLFQNATKRAQTQQNKGKIATLSVEDLVKAASFNTTTSSTSQQKQVMVQKLEFVDLALEIGARKEHKQEALSKWPTFQSQIPDKVLWHYRILGQLHTLEKVLALEYRLRADYQIFVDTEGKIIHFDLERVNSGRGKNNDPNVHVNDMKLIANFQLKDTLMRRTPTKRTVRT